MELPQLFKKFDQQISITEAMRQDLIRGHRTLRERIEQDGGLSKIVETTFLQGSYRRQTIIRPFADKRSDVDVVVVTNLDRGSVSPRSALDKFRAFLDRHYPGKHCAQGRSWGIELSYAALDLVVTSAPSLAMSERLKLVSHDGDRDDQMDWASVKAEPLWIPDREAQVWSDTHPLKQIEWTHQKNARTGGNFVAVVRALKWWRRKQENPKHPKGYPLEHLIGDCCPDGITSTAEGVTRTLEYIAARGTEVPRLSDRGVTSNVFARIQPGDYRAFHNLSAKAAKLARSALASPDVRASAEQWRGLFGAEFPLA